MSKQCWIQKYIIKLLLRVYFFFFNVASRKLKITRVIGITFLLDGAGLDTYDRKMQISK